MEPGRVIVMRLDTIKSARIRAVFLAAALLTCIGSAYADDAALSQEELEHRYCVQQGFLYKTVDGPSGKIAQCVLSNGYVCSAHDFYTGSCRPGSMQVRYIDDMSRWGYPSDTVVVDESGYNSCMRAGGRIETMHTIYGDILICVHPDGNYYTLGYPTSQDRWRIMAENWLNAP